MNHISRIHLHFLRNAPRNIVALEISPARPKLSYASGETGPGFSR
ncbi:unnamed protein product [Penicillium roqueforti FM164]|uniref:Genomic scaffold, ProqFM164S01 n=1 Tax=Penicillium roqueforti (strain FM164) TaxID=1365484 RepID=W6PQP8_PENRF|nr:unnamed protein product [Penicillium roqueforti FM164]